MQHVTMLAIAQQRVPRKEYSNTDLLGYVASGPKFSEAGKNIIPPPPVSACPPCCANSNANQPKHHRYVELATRIVNALPPEQIPTVRHFVVHVVEQTVGQLVGGGQKARTPTSRRSSLGVRRRTLLDVAVFRYACEGHITVSCRPSGSARGVRMAAHWLRQLPTGLNSSRVELHVMLRPEYTQHL